MSTVTVLHARKMQLEAQLAAGADGEELEAIKRELTRVEIALDLLEPGRQNPGNARNGGVRTSLP